MIDRSFYAGCSQSSLKGIEHPQTPVGIEDRYFDQWKELVVKRELPPPSPSLLRRAALLKLKFQSK